MLTMNPAPAPSVDDTDCIFTPFPAWETRDEAVQLGECGETFYNWLRFLCCDPNATPHWMSSYQLLVHFQQHTGLAGPTCVHKQWYDWENRPDQDREYSFTQQATWISHYVRRLGTAFGLELNPLRCRPSGSSIAMWTRCYKLNVPAAVVGGVDRWILTSVGQPITKVGRQ